jgi:hypothetical protein
MPEVDRRAAMLPEGLIQENIKSWKDVSKSYDDLIVNPYWKRLLPIQALVRKLAKSEQSKLFRAGRAMYFLIVSTREKHGLQNGVEFIIVNPDLDSGILIEYKQILWEDRRAFDTETKLYIDVGVGTIESRICGLQEDLASAIQPFLDKLWKGTRGV